jgi:hypothetical protein
MKRDFAEAIQGKMDNEVQGDNFGEIRKMMLEGCSVGFFVLKLDEYMKEFQTNLLDDCKENVVTSFKNMKKVLEYLRERGVLHENMSAIYDNTYMSAAANTDVQSWMFYSPCCHQCSKYVSTAWYMPLDMEKTKLMT